MCPSGGGLGELTLRPILEREIRGLSSMPFLIWACTPFDQELS